MPNATDEVSIEDLRLRCNFPTGHHDTRASTICNGWATSVVYNSDMPRLRMKARCGEHQGMLDAERRGTVLKAVPRTWAGSIEAAHSI